MERGERKASWVSGVRRWREWLEEEPVSMSLAPGPRASSQARPLGATGGRAAGPVSMSLCSRLSADWDLSSVVLSTEQERAGLVVVVVLVVVIYKITARIIHNYYIIPTAGVAK